MVVVLGLLAACGDDAAMMMDGLDAGVDAPAAPDKHARPALIAFLVAELGALVFYMSVSRPMWFYLDEWDFLVQRKAGNLGDLFRSHNGHWTTLPILAYRFLFWMF